jgi:hypothetical protein
LLLFALAAAGFVLADGWMRSGTSTSGGHDHSPVAFCGASPALPHSAARSTTVESAPTAVSRTVRPSQSGVGSGVLVVSLTDPHDRRAGGAGCGSLAANSAGPSLVSRHVRLQI